LEKKIAQNVAKPVCCPWKRIVQKYAYCCDFQPTSQSKESPNPVTLMATLIL
jgi:hypothetical protein